VKTIYCIPGLGANEKCFEYLDLSFAQPVFINWIQPYKNETLQHYAMRLKEQFIHDENPVIFGLSLGGMLAVEMGKLLPSAKIIIISSAKAKTEIPYYFKFFKYIPLYKFLPEWSVRKQTALRNYFLGAKKRTTKKYVKQVAEKADANFYRWAMGAILSWQNKIIPPNIVHIHGTNDKLLPSKFITADKLINNGGHLIIIENAEEVSSLIKNLIPD
jgi:pimeloyl-ACP methyl ester carboxylesterase